MPNGSFIRIYHNAKLHYLNKTRESLCPHRHVFGAVLWVGVWVEWPPCFIFFYRRTDISSAMAAGIKHYSPFIAPRSHPLLLDIYRMEIITAALICSFVPHFRADCCKWRHSFDTGPHDEWGIIGVLRVVFVSEKVHYASNKFEYRGARTGIDILTSSFRLGSVEFLGNVRATGNWWSNKLVSINKSISSDMKGHTAELFLKVKSVGGEN
jgi:hypothetical protein